MEPEDLRAALTDRGLNVLHVGQDEHDPAALTVYLHGTAGKHADGHALAICREVPGVAEVRDSAVTPTIILVRVT